MKVVGEIILCEEIAKEGLITLRKGDMVEAKVLEWGPKCETVQGKGVIQFSRKRALTHESIDGQMMVKESDVEYFMPE